MNKIFILDIQDKGKLYIKSKEKLKKEVNKAIEVIKSYSEKGIPSEIINFHFNNLVEELKYNMDDKDELIIENNIIKIIYEDRNYDKELRQLSGNHKERVFVPYIQLNDNYIENEDKVKYKYQLVYMCLDIYEEELLD